MPTQTQTSLGTLVIDEIIFHIQHIRLLKGVIQFEATTQITPSAQPRTVSKSPDLNIFAPDGTLIVTLRLDPDAPTVTLRPGSCTWLQDVRVTDQIATWLS